MITFVANHHWIFYLASFTSVAYFCYKVKTEKT